MQKRKMISNYKKILTIIGNILVFISFLFIFKIIIDNYQTIEHLEFNLKNIYIFILLLFLSIFGYLLFSFAWVLQLKDHYPSFNTKLSFYIISLSQIAKYLPGNIGHFVGRFYLAKKVLSKQDIIYTMFIENIMFISVSLLLGFGYIYYFDYTKYINLDEFSFSTFILIFSIISIGIFLKYFKPKINLLKIKFLNIIKIFFIFLIMSFIGGLSIYILINLIVETNNISYLQCVTGFSLSFLIGFIMPGAPAGIGVREYTFVLLFSPFLGEIYALEIIIIFRIITIISDILLFFIGKQLAKSIN